MKTYFKIIKYIQETLLIISILTLMGLPLLIVFRPELMTGEVTSNLYSVSHLFLFFVMLVRPLADIITGLNWIRPLVILRKGAGVMSASIIVSFILAKLMVDPATYLGSLGTLKYWSMVNYAILAHVADIAAVILLITSNNLSKRWLGGWWKKIQQLSYVYLYGSVLYVYFSYRNIYLLVVLIIISLIVYLAYLSNQKRLAQSLTAVAPVGPRSEPKTTIETI